MIHFRSSHSARVFLVIILASCLASCKTSSSPTGPGGTGTGWKLVTSGTTTNLNGVSAAGGNLYAAGDNGVVLLSTDGGLTWTALPATGITMHNIVFADKLHGMAATYYGVSITTDGGQTWVNRDLGGAVYESVAFIGNVVYAAGNDNSSEGIVSMSSDGGNQWQDVISPQVYLRSRMNAVAMASPTDICVAGVYGDVGVSSFSYIDWTTQLFQFISLNFYSVAMPNVKDIFVAGDSGAIIHCIDSGYHWTKQTTGVTTTLRCVAFFDGMTGLAAGDSGVILYTKNGGTTWQNMSIPGNNFSSCAFIDASDAVVVGKNGAIYRAKLP
jgi:photosystem II stability/assembly factor-like uncharacterized protein